jgi:hypothetical protein
MEGTRLNGAIKLFSTLIIFVFIALIFAQAQKKFTLDELDFPIVAKATSETGRPVYYRGEATPQHLGLYHPPLYIYALAAQIKVFGFSENSVRTFGLACTLLTAYLALMLGRDLFPESKRAIFGIVFLGLYLLNPYTIANTTLPDIDSTILPPLLTLFALLLLKGRSDLILASMFALLLWAKLTTPLAFIPFAMVYWKYAQQSTIKILQKAAIVFCGGALLFCSTYWIYCKLLKLPFSYTFGFLVHSFTKGSASPSLEMRLVKIWENLGYSTGLITAITIPLVFLFVASIVFLAFQRTTPETRQQSMFFMLLCAAVTLFYCSLIAPFGGFFKYPFAVFQFGCIGISAMIIRCMEKLGRRHCAQLLILGVLAVAFAFLQGLVWKDSPTFGIEASASFASVVAIVGGVAAGFLLLGNNALSKGGAALALAFFAATVGTGIGIARFQAISPFPTKYSYGQLGMEETISYLRANLNPGEVIWSMKDVGFYTGNRYIENYEFFFTPGAGGQIKEIVDSGVRFFVVTQRIGEDRIDAYPDIRNALESCCKLQKNFGNYYIYIPK